MMNKLSLDTLDKSDWKLIKFQEIAERIAITVDPTTTELEVYVGLEHIDAEDIHIRRLGKPSDVKGNKLKCFKGDVIFGKRRAYQRKAAIVEFDGMCSAHSFVFRAKPNIIDPQLFPFFLHSDQFMHRAVDISVGGLSPTINWGDLKDEEFLLPPKEEQKKLAELLWAMDEVIEKEKGLLNNINRAYVSIIEKELLGKSFSKIFLSEMGSVIRGVSYNPEDLVPEYSEENCIILRSNNISNGMVNYNDIKVLPKSKVKKEQLLLHNDFAICMSNGSKELVGKSSRYYYNDKNVATGSFCAGFRPKSEKSSDLLSHLFFSETYRQTIKRTLSGSAINNLKASDIEELSFRIKPENERAVIIEKLNNMVSSKNIIEIAINCSQSLQKSLINQIF